MSLHLAFLLQIGASCLAAAPPIEQCGGPVQILQGDVLIQTRRSPTARVGIDVIELKTAGLAVGQLKDAGISATELKAADFEAKELNQAGFSADQLKAAGFSAVDLSNAEISVDELKAVGFSAADLTKAQIPVSELAQASDSTNATVEVAGPRSTVAMAVHAPASSSQPPASSMPSAAPTITSGQLILKSIFKSPNFSNRSSKRPITIRKSIFKSPNYNPNLKSPNFCDPPETENVEMFQPSRYNQTMLATAPVPLANSSVHKIVGDNGVIMLSMTRFPDRSTYASSQLIRIGIYPILLPATDGNCASKAALEKGCGSQGTCSSGRTGTGCVSANEQAVADSHRRALEVALKRQEEWTAIFEDDAIPVFGDNVDWNSEFEKAWATKPETATIVRLSWCLPPGMHAAGQITNQTGSFFQWVRTDVASGCTAAYMVHKSIVPEMLKAFPCCCAVDCCYAWDVYHKHAWDISLAAVGGEEWIKENEIADWGEHDGVIMQAKSKHGLKSARTLMFQQ